MHLFFHRSPDRNEHRVAQVSDTSLESDLLKVVREIRVRNIASSCSGCATAPTAEYSRGRSRRVSRRGSDISGFSARTSRRSAANKTKLTRHPAGRGSSLPTAGYAAAMIPLSFRAPDSGLTLDVTLANKTLKPLVGELWIVSPILADKVGHAVRQPGHIVLLQEHEVPLIAAAAKTVSNSLVDDPALEQLRALGN